MRLFWWEVRKLWRWPVVVAVVAVNLLLFYMLLADGLRYSYNEEGEQRVIARLRELAGDTLEPEELPAAQGLLERYYDDVSAIMQSDPAFVEAGFTSGEELWTIAHTLPDETDEEAAARRSLWDRLVSEFVFGQYLQTSDYAFWKIQALYTFLEEYKGFEAKDFTGSFGITLTGAHVDRLRQYAEEGAHHNIFSARSYEDTVNTFSVCALIVVISIGILILPYLTADRQQRILGMQWSARAGRRTLRTQFAAAMASAGVLVLMLPAVYVGLFLAHRPAYLSQLQRPIFSLLGHAHSLSCNPLFWQIILISALICAALGIGAAGLFFFLSRHSSNTVSELLGAIPAGAAVGALGVAVLFMLFSEQNPVGKFLRVPFAEVLVTGFVLLIGLALCIVTLRREAGRELL